MYLRFHVQPTPDPLFCQNNAITSCGGIQRATDATGTLEFDIFLDPASYHPDTLTLRRLEADLTFPETWELISFHGCGGGGGYIIPYPGGGHLVAEWPDPPFVHEVLLAARITAVVDGYGIMDIEQYAQVTVGPGPDYQILDARSIDAQAGVVCSVCDWPCANTSWGCRPWFDPEVGELTVYPGGAAETTFLVGIDEIAGPNTCPPEFTATEPWLSFTVVDLGGSWPRLYEVIASVEATGLDPGTYSGWIRGESVCIGCGEIRLTVSTEVGAPDGNPLITTVSWGRLKQHYR